MVYRTAAYCRLSKEDDDSGLSESIENQLAIIEEYILKSGDLELVDIYIDDGYSGMNFDRPEFVRMIQDVKDKRIDAIITKDMSRLGREHIGTSNYRELVFPKLGIRYISVLDGIDSLSHENEELAQFKSLFNDMYSRDISKKIIGALNAKKKTGAHMSGLAPYGYIKDPYDKHKLIIDEEAAEVVQRIYSLFLQGFSKKRIAKMLNEESVMTPSEYKRKVLKINYKNGNEKEKKGWSYSTINVILKNRMYTGAMVSHKTAKISYKVDKEIPIPPKDQIIVENMHEAIIKKDIFNQVQELAKKRTRIPGFGQHSDKVNPYAGLLVCGDCGYHIHRVTCRNGYDCATYHSKGTRFCFSHFTPKNVLDGIVKYEVEKQYQHALQEKDEVDIVKMAELQNGKNKAHIHYQKQVERLRSELDKAEKYKKKTYENYVDGILNKKEYICYKAEYEEEANKLQREMELLLKRISEEESIREKEHKTWITEFVKAGELKEVTRELVVEIIEEIQIHGERMIDITFKYKA